MRISILTLGSRGDVEPYLALGIGLQEAGNQVVIAAHANFEADVRSHGLAFVPVEGNPREVLAASDVTEIGRNGLLFARWFEQAFRPFARQVFEAYLEASCETDLILFSILAYPAGFHVAEKVGVPAFPAYVQPFTPTQAFASLNAAPLPNWVPFPNFYNWLTHKLVYQGYFQVFRQIVNQCRQDVLGLPPLSAWSNFRFDTKAIPHLYGFSPSVIPRPKEWGDHIEVTGYWFLPQPAEWRPTNELLDFLDSGPPPIYVGFGSMNSGDPQQLTSILIEALARTRQRAILATGWGGLSHNGLSDDIFVVNSIPHSWLFPRVSVVIHHGGAGTTAAALRAGVPSIVIPFFADQPFWGDHAHRLGVSPRPILRKDLSSERLVPAIEQTVCNHLVRSQAEELGEQIRCEDGVSRAVEVIDRWMRLL